MHCPPLQRFLHTFVEQNKLLNSVEYIHLGPGQLTGTGMNQTFLLGAKIRSKYSRTHFFFLKFGDAGMVVIISLISRYVDTSGVLSGNYSAQECYFRASGLDRTLMSAQCVGMGLFPPGTGPINDLSGYPSSSSLLISHPKPSCALNLRDFIYHLHHSQASCIDVWISAYSSAHS